MQDYRPFLNADDDTLLRELVLLQSELANAVEELSLSKVGYENAYVAGLMAGDTVAERERSARTQALPLRVSVIELEARIRVLELGLDLLRYLLGRRDAQ